MRVPHVVLAGGFNFWIVLRGNVARPGLGKQSSAIKPQDGANLPEDAPPPSCHHWGTLDFSILEQIPEAVIATDPEANIIGGNSAALEMYGYPAEELVSKNLSILCPEEEGPALHVVIKSARENGHCRAELRTRQKLGTDVFVQASLSSLVDGNSVPVGMVAILADITERKLLEAALKQSQGRQQKAAIPGQQAQGPKTEVVHRQINDTRFLIASPIMHKFMTMVERVASYREIVLITGETGSGKELIARSVHDNSSRHNKPWVDINCAALPEHLVESELFG